MFKQTNHLFERLRFLFSQRQTYGGLPFYWLIMQVVNVCSYGKFYKFLRIFGYNKQIAVAHF